MSANSYRGFFIQFLPKIYESDTDLVMASNQVNVFYGQSTIQLINQIDLHLGMEDDV